METFAKIEQRAVNHWGAQYLSGRLPAVFGGDFRSRGDAFYLSAMVRRVFRAGLKHSLVDSKWPAFEKALWGFKPASLALLSEDQIDSLMMNTALIRHRGKLRTVPINAQMVLDIAEEHGSVGDFIANWPVTDIIGLWRYLKNRGAHLGGNSAASFLRMVGKDTFVFSNDVVGALKTQGVVDKLPTSKRDLAAVQETFNRWHEESGRPLCEISMILACSFSAPDGESKSSV